MTPEAFEAKWGGPLRACGADPDEIMGNCGDEYAEDTARGLLIAWAAERKHFVGRSLASRWSFWNDNGDTILGDNECDTFDAALIAGCIALAKQEATK